MRCSACFLTLGLDRDSGDDELLMNLDETSIPSKNDGDRRGTIDELLMNLNETSMENPVAVRWIGGSDGFLRLLDQTLLPTQVEYLECRSVQTVWDAIKILQVRGAPAIGIAAAYGVCLGAAEGGSAASFDRVAHGASRAAEFLATSRPTAVNLFWALDRMRGVVERHQSGSDSIVLRDRLLAEARAIHEEDRAMCRAIGKHGAALIQDRATVLTHCNAGGLATAEYGTALSVIFTCQDQNKAISVFVDETRPLWQGARLTAWELSQRNIPTTLICDSMAGHVMSTRRIDAVIVGADRITACGDVANKIGTYGLAVLAKFHQVPFYVAASSSSFDLAIDSGREIPIEERKAEEIVAPNGTRIAPEGVTAYNPAFDVTPAELISALITEHGIIQPVSRELIRQHFDCQ